MELKKYVIECKKCGKQFEIECTENNYQKLLTNIKRYGIIYLTHKN